MARVFIPPNLKDVFDQDFIEVEASSVRGVIQSLDELHAGVAVRLCDDNGLKPGISVSIDGKITSLGLYQKLSPDSEVHFIPSIGGG